MSREKEAAHDLLTQLELAIEREQEIWKGPPEEIPPERVAIYAAVHESLGAFRNALSEILEEE
jgi:hypothetical protein